MTALLREGGRPLHWLLVLALVLRIAMGCWPAFAHADEVWQYLEPARHVAGRPWIVTWEGRAGARGWLLPVLVAGPMALGQWLAPGTFLNILLPRLLCAIGSLALVAAAAGLGFRLSRQHGLIAAFVTAIWYELVYFAPRTLTEPIATALILCAAWLLTERRARASLVAGLLLGLACTVRFQYAPAAFVIAAWALRGNWPLWRRVVAGGVAGLVLGALADLAMGGVPFAWVLRNLTLNLVDNRSAEYGTTPFYGYMAILWKTWGVAGPVVLLLAGIGARRYPALAVAALVNLLLHALIPHKEARFVLLSTTLAVVLAAFGSVDLAARSGTAFRARPFAAAWLVLSLCGAVGMPGWGRLTRLHAAWRVAGQVPGVCGVGIYRTTLLVASHALIARDVPLYQYDAASAGAARRSRAFDVVLEPVAHRGELHGYRERWCGGGKPTDLCVATRPGPCVTEARDATFEANRFMARADF